MPKYKLQDGREYNIPEDKVKDFLSYQPNAQVVKDSSAPFYLQKDDTQGITEQKPLQEETIQKPKSVFDIPNKVEPKIPDLMKDSGVNPYILEKKLSNPAEQVKTDQDRKQSNYDRAVISSYRNKYLNNNLDKIKSDPQAVSFLQQATNQEDLESRLNQLAEPNFKQSKDYHLMNAELESKGDPSEYFKKAFEAFRQNKELFKDSDNDTTETNLNSIGKSIIDSTKTKQAVQNPIGGGVFAGASYPATHETYDKEVESDMKDFLANTEIGRNYSNAEKKHLESLSNRIKPLLNKAETLRQGASKRGFESHNDVPGFPNVGAMRTTGNALLETSLMNKSINVLKESKRMLESSELKNKLAQFGKGAKVTQEDLLQFATFTEFLNDARLNDVIDKYENDPESLTEEESLALEAKAVADQISAGVDAGSMFNIGKGVKDSASYMRDFIMTAPIGAAFAGAAKGAVNKLAQKSGIDFLLSRGAGKTIDKAVKGLIDLTVRPSTQMLFQPSSYAMAFKDMQGQLSEEDGKIKADNRKDFSLLGAYDENQSEVLGDVVLDGMFRRIGVPWMSKMPSKLSKALGKTTGIQGPLSEYVEEKYSDSKSVLRGEMTLEDFFDPRKNIETAGVVLAIQIPFAGIKTVSKTAGKIHERQQIKSINQAYEQTSAMLDKEAGDLSSNFKEFVTDAVSTGDENTIKQAIFQVVDNPTIPDNVKRAVTSHFIAEQAKQGLEQAKAENVQESEDKSQTGAQLYVRSQLQKKSNSLNWLQSKKGMYEQRLGELSNITEDNIQEVIASDQITDEQLEVWNNYNAIRSTYNGVIKQVQSDIENYLAPQVNTLKNVAREDGTIIEVDLAGDERNSHVVSGNIILDENGYVDRNKSDKVLVVVDSEGNRKQVSLDHVDNVKIDNLEESTNALQQSAYEKYLRPLANKLEGKAEYSIGDQVEYINPQSKVVAGQVVAKQGETVTIANQEGKTETLTAQELSNNVIGPQMQVADLSLKGGETLQLAIDGQVFEGTVTDIADEKATINIENGPKGFEWKDWSAEELATAIAPPAQAEVQEQELSESNISEQENAENATDPIEPVQQNDSEITETVANSQNVPLTPEQEQEQLVASLPKTKDGDIDYDNIADDDTFITALQSEFPGSESEIVDEYKKQAEQSLKGANRIKDPIKKKRAQKQAQTKIDRFTNLYDKLNPRTQYETRMAELEDGNIRERESKMGEYRSLRDFLFRNIATGKFKFRWNDNGTNKGLAGEILANKNTESERRKRISFLNNDGFSPESLAEYITENAGQGSEINPGWFRDMAEVRNEINDILLSHDTPTAMIESATELRREPESYEEYAEQFIDPALVFDYEANETSQNEMLSSLPTPEQHNEISNEEIETYYTNQISKEEYNNYINSINFETNKTKNDTTDSDQGTRVVDNSSDVIEDSRAGEITDDTRGDSSISSSNERQGESDIENERETEITGERSSQDRIEQPNQERTEQDARRPIAGSTDSVEQDVQEVIEAQQPNTNPTEAQKEAGNYKKAHINVAGFDITIENPKGSERSGTDPDGNKWSHEMKSHYGYFKGTEGKDGDHIDTFIGGNTDSRYVFVVDQINEDGTFDEHKVMLGYDSAERAKEAYLENYDKGWKGLGAITVVELEDFRNWLDSDTKRIKPFAEYRQIQESLHETEVVEQSSSKLSEAQQEADDALQDFLDAFNDLNSENLGIVDNTAEKQAKMLIAGTKMVGAFTKLGVYKFADLVNNIAQKDVQLTEELLSAIKKAYGAFSAENDIDELDEMKTVRAFKLSDIANEKKDAEINDTEEDTDEELNRNVLKLVSTLNDGRKAKDAYGAITVYDHKNYRILQVENKNGDKIFNLLDETGNIPQSSVANFRTINHVIKDLSELTGESPYEILAKQIWVGAVIENKKQKINSSDKEKTKKSTNNQKDNVSLDSKNRFIQEVFDKIGNEKLTIISLRKIADSVGLKDAKDTELQEYTELAIIKKAKQIVSQEGISREDKYKEILQLYDDQPTISMRSSERVSKQQYSTPIPLSFIAGEFINGINPGRVLEPSAGNGMMVFNTNPESVIANEIDEVRLENLREQSFMEVTSQDGTLEFNIEPVDAVVTNPPFGKSEKRDYEGYKIAGLAEQMSVNALQNMKDDGRAAIIIGGNTKYNSNGTLASERAFLNYLYDKYNVIDVINIDGSLYRKQGTSFPVRMILANGRRTGFDAVERRYAPLQKDARSETIKTFDELLQRFNEDEKDLLHKREPIEPDNRDGRNEEAEDGNRGNIPERTPKTGGSGGGGRRKPGTSGNGSPKDRGPADTPKPDSGIDNDGGSDILDIQGDRGDGVDSGLERGTGGVQGEDVSSLYDGSRTRPEPLKIDIESEKTPYPARSKSNPIGSVVPTNMAQSIDTILYKFKDIDTYVQVKLGYETKEELFDALAAEQIDSVALAIQQIEKGEGLIIGDMTGVGKGRQAAAIIRYAVRSGKKPIFMTEKANLFSDMYRDLRDIGSGDLKPFIVNSKGSSGDPSMTDENGVVIYSPLPNNKKKDVINSNTIPNEYDYVAITYSQLNGNIKKKGASDKQTFFASIATDNILILDESHNAGGDGNTGAFMASVLPSTKGVVYLSATFAKRPDNMPIYALKTSMRDANMSEDELITAIQRGGVPLQEIMSKNLSETGQMVRRERDFTGVSIDWEQMTENIEENKARFDDVIQIFNDLIVFQEDYINPVIDIKNADLARVQGFFEQRKGTENMGISNTPFASKTFNLVRQMLFSLKAEHVANEAINEIKAGRKPVIAIGNTMETFLSELGEAGEIVEKHDYSISLKKGLDSLFKATETDANGEQTHATIPLSDLSLKGQAKYAELNKRINEFSSGITISPIDVIKDKITKAGYSIGEMTGRKVELVFDENGNATIERRQNTDKKKIARDFNGGDLDALIFNQAAATGISLHASNKFRDQKQRVMLFAQTQLDVNTEVQMRGRIDRTGQVVRGAYRYIISPIPAEQRMIMMFKAKLKSLDANTTSNQKSKANDIEIVDFLNKYGDEVLVEYLKENPEINDKLLDPLKLKGLDDKELEATVSIEGAASKAAGRAALLTVKEQESFYKDITDKYTTLINYLNDNGENDLEITVMPLNAETKAKHVVVEGKNNGNPFAENSVRETVEIDVIKKPMSISEIDELIQTLVEGKSSIEYRNYLLELVDERIDAQIKVESNNIQSRRDEKRAEHLEALSKSKNRKTLTPEEVVQFKKLDAESYDSTTKAQIDKRAEKIKGTGDAVKTIIKMFPAGNMVMVPSTMNIDSFTTFSEGMFLGFRMKDKITPSTVTAIFATLDGRRRIDVPLSKVGFLRAAHSESLATRRWMKVNRDNWDSRIPSRTRKTAYVITGNILQAYGNSELRGQLISYTTSSGEVKQGILLPERYKPDEQSMRVQVKSAADKLIKENMPLVDTSNGVSISREDSKSFSISVPLSKARGGKFYLDEGLRDLVVGRDFRQMAGQMVGVVKQDNIIKALEYLSDKFNISVDTDMKEINADELNSDKGKNNSKLSKEEDEEDKPKSRAFEYIAELDERLSLTDTPEQAIAVVTNMVNELESKFDTSAETVILPSKKAILDELTKAGASKESIEDIRNDKSVYFGSFYKGRIYINASAIRDSEDVIRVWSHENFHAWINNNSELLVPLMSEFETEELDGLIPENYLGTTKKTKLGELLAYSAEDVFAGRRFKDGDVQNKIKSLLTKYIDYATSGQFSERGASFGRNALAFRYNQGSEQEGDRTSQNGERADQRQETDRNIQKSDSGVPGTRKIDLSETINIDGVQRSTTNSDGKPIATTEQGVKNFWKWFGDSKVVDKDGRPLVVYHGTSTDINTFKGSQYYDGGTEYYNKDFSYFTPYKETAKLYAYYSALRKFAKNNNLEYDVNYSFKDNNSTYENQIDQFIKEHYEEVPTDISEWMEYADEFYSEWFENESNIRIIPVYLNIKNPKIVDDYIDGSKRKEQIEKFSKEYDNKLFDGAIFNKINDSAFIDGVLTGTTIIATSPNQIKSVDNVGTFSEDNDDIRFRAIDRAKEFMDYPDHFKYMINDYPKFLSDVLYNVLSAEERQNILDKAKENGWITLNDEIEKHLSEVEDPEVLDSIKNMIGANLTDSQLKYLLWRNINQDDGTLIWKAKDVVKQQQLAGDTIFQEGDMPTEDQLSEYENRMKSSGFKFTQEVFDDLESLKVLQELITGKKMDDVSFNQNAYKAFRLYRGRAREALTRYMKNIYAPMIQKLSAINEKLDNTELKSILSDLQGNKTSYTKATVYAMAKSGLSRMEWMARRDADKYKSDALNNPKILELDNEEYEKAVKDINDKAEYLYKKLKKNDVSGLTALAKLVGRSSEQFKDVAQSIVSEVEKVIGENEINELWDEIRKTNSWVIEKQYQGGKLTKEQYEKLKDMDPYYLPHRGYDMTTAGDVYDYRDMYDGNFQTVFKHAKGRMSLAEDPFAHIASMAASGILDAEKNKAKQKLFRMIANNANNIVTVNDLYVQNIGTEEKPEWVEVYPDINADDAPEVVQTKLDSFNKKMVELTGVGMAKKKSNILNLGMPVGKGNPDEHAIKVSIGGKEKVMYVNGNPTIAQAVNGLFANKENKDFNKFVKTVNRHLSAAYTSWNPEFGVSNGLRDAHAAVSFGFVENGWKYSADLLGNILSSMPTVANYIWKGEYKGKNSDMLEEFYRNGGPNGYTLLKSIENYTDDIKTIHSQTRGSTSSFNLFKIAGGYIENFNQMIELNTRFATYVTSKKFGKSEGESAYDAKNITLNFERHGAYQNAIMKYFANWVIFSNAAMQGVYRMYEAGSKNQARMAGVIGTHMAMGGLIPFITLAMLEMFGSDDDKEKYKNIPLWMKCNNLVLYSGNGKYFMYPLSHEFRWLYGLGVISAEAVLGNLKGQNIAALMAEQMTSMLPIDGMSGPIGLAPSMTKPLLEVLANKNFMGRPIYKDTQWNKLDPEWTKVYGGTWKSYIEISKKMNEITGGDNVKKGAIENGDHARINNPAVMQHLTRGYFGGGIDVLGNFVDIVTNAASNIENDEKTNPSDIPFVRRVFRKATDSDADNALRRDMRSVEEFVREVEHLEKGYRDNISNDTYREKFIELINSSDYVIYRNLKSQIKQLDKVKEINDVKKRRELEIPIQKQITDYFWENQ